MAYHYGLCASARAKAFKYLVKTCDVCTYQKAYDSAIKFGVKAMKIATTRTELKVLRRVICAAIKGVQSRKSASTKSFLSTKRVDTMSKTSEELTSLLDSIDNQIEIFNNRIAVGQTDEECSAVDSKFSNLSNSSFDNSDTVASSLFGNSVSKTPQKANMLGMRKSSILMNKQMSRKLMWQASLTIAAEKDDAEGRSAASGNAWFGGCIVS